MPAASPAPTDRIAATPPAPADRRTLSPAAPGVPQSLLDGRSLSLELSDPQDGHVYNEEAFRYFLQIERKRSGRSNRRFLLLLVELVKRPGTSAHFDTGAAAKLFAALSPCLRDTDVLGWYRQERVAGVVLTQLGETAGTAVSRLVEQRVREALVGSLPANLTERIQVRIYQQPSGATD